VGADILEGFASLLFTSNLKIKAAYNSEIMHILHRMSKLKRVN
jgi:hypothetical protein